MTFWDNALAELTMMDIAVDTGTDGHAWSTPIHLTDRFKLTAYDASYLELAHLPRLPLATLDEPLRRGGAALGGRVDWIGGEVAVKVRKNYYLSDQCLIRPWIR